MSMGKKIDNKRK